MWDLKTGKVKAVIADESGQFSLATSLAFSPDGSLLIAASYAFICVHVVADLPRNAP